jgi:hypothetical protein
VVSEGRFCSKRVKEKSIVKALRIQVFWDVMLCHRAGDSCCFKQS